MQNKRTVIVWIVALVVVFLGLIGGLFYYLQNKADASVVSTVGTVCPQFVSPDPNACTGGTWVESTPTADGCPKPPTCVKTLTPTPSVTSTTACGVDQNTGIPMPCIDSGDEVTYDLTNGFNLIVVPESMYRNTNPISSSAFTSAGLTVYNYSNGNWQINPTYLRQGGSYLVRNRDNAKPITIRGNGMQAVGAHLGQVIYKGWNMVANNSDMPKPLSDLSFKTYVTDNNCTTPPICGEFKSLAQLLTEKRIYSRIFYFNDLTSSDANTFYATKILTDADLLNYKIPAKTGFWMYLFQ